MNLGDKWGLDCFRWLVQRFIHNREFSVERCTKGDLRHMKLPSCPLERSIETHHDKYSRGKNRNKHQGQLFKDDHVWSCVDPGERERERDIHTHIHIYIHIWLVANDPLTWGPRPGRSWAPAWFPAWRSRWKEWCTPGSKVPSSSCLQVEVDL